MLPGRPPPRPDSPPPALMIRPPRWTTVFATVGCVFALVLVVGIDGAAGKLISIVIGIALGYVTILSVRVSARADREGLEIRNFRGARRVGWHEIEDFKAKWVRTFDGSGPSLVVLLRSGKSIRIAAIMGHSEHD